MRWQQYLDQVYRGTLLIKFEIATLDEIPDLSRLSVSLGNIPLIPGQSNASVVRMGAEIVGFAAVQAAAHTAGSWVHPDWRRQGVSRHLRIVLENDMRQRGITHYFSIPGNDFERQLFAKYGPVSEHVVQIKEL